MSASEIADPVAAARSEQARRAARAHWDDPGLDMAKVRADASRAGRASRAPDVLIRGLAKAELTAEHRRQLAELLDAAERKANAR